MCTTTTFTSSDTTAPTQDRGLTWKLSRSSLTLTLLILVVGFASFLSSSKLFAGEVEHARELGRQYNADVEARLWDGTLTELLAYQWVGEVDWAPKWAEGICQCLYYSIVLERQPVLFLLTKRGEERFVYRAQTVCAKYKINLVVVWVQ